MKKTITLATFRRVHAAEETMMRIVMPRTSASDPLPSLPFTAPGEVIARRTGSRLARPLTFTMAEVAHA